jgi:arylsulfatase A-like enzyme
MMLAFPPVAHPFRRVARLTAVLLAAAFARAAERPLNILHLHADDHRADAVRALGNPVVQTPHLDALVARGMTFTRAYTMGAMTPAVCLPSRTMMLTGRSLFRIGPPAKDVPGTTPLPTVLKRAGYETWRMGKYGNEYFAAARAFDTNIDDSAQGEGEAGSRAFASRRLADRAIQHLKSRDRTKPFYLYLAPPVPHDPRQAEPEFHRLYDPAKLPLPPAFQPVHDWDNGDMTVRDEKLAPWPRTPEDTRRQLADYYAAITGLDHHFGRIISALRETGELDHTLVVFSADNGLSIGDHGLFGKQNLYEFGGMHVPLVIAGPGVAHGRSDAFVYLMDLYPTFCDFAGATAPSDIEGVSLRPILAGRPAPTRPVLFTAYQDVQRAVRDERWKLIRYPQVDRTQLFDLSADPHERTNLAADPAHQATLARLRRLLEQQSAQWGDKITWSAPTVRPATWTPPAPGAASPK